MAENTAVVGAFSGLLHVHEASTDTLHTLASLLSHPQFPHKFLEEVQSSLANAYSTVEAIFTGVRHLTPSTRAL